MTREEEAEAVRRFLGGGSFEALRLDAPDIIREALIKAVVALRSVRNIMSTWAEDEDKNRHSDISVDHIMKAISKGLPDGGEGGDNG